MECCKWSLGSRLNSLANATTKIVHPLEHAICLCFSWTFVQLEGDHLWHIGCDAGGNDSAENLLAQEAGARRTQTEGSAGECATGAQAAVASQAPGAERRPKMYSVHGEPERGHLFAVRTRLPVRGLLVPSAAVLSGVPSTHRKQIGRLHFITQFRPC